MSLFWTDSRKREFIFDVESEFLSDNIKWFFCDFAHEDSCETGIDIFLSYFVADDFFIILFDSTWFVDRA